MNILGIAFGHGSSASLVSYGQVVAAIEEEKLNRIKGYSGFPFMAMEYVLQHGGLERNDVDYVALGCNDIGEWSYNHQYIARVFSQSGMTSNVKYLLMTGIRLFAPDLDFSASFTRYFYRQMARLGFDFRKIIPVNHHMAHAAGAYYGSPWRRALILTSDGKGDGISTAVYNAVEDEITPLAQEEDLVSIGQLYQAVTKHLGYRPNRHEGKITGLAALGDKECCLGHFEKILQFDSDSGHFHNLFQEREDFQRDPLGYYLKDVRPKTWIKPHYVRSLNGHLRRFAIGYQMYLNYLQDTMGEEEPADLAAGVQELTERLITAYCQRYLRQFDLPINICLSGGLFANVKVNQRINALPGVGHIYVQQAMDDAGTSLGAALSVWMQKRDNSASWPTMDTVYLGPTYSEGVIESSLLQSGIRYQKSNFVEQEVARYVAEGKIVGRFNGGLEWGPRALGNRSILASAKDKNINEVLNKRLKRTEFMPFAPSVLAEDGPLYFKGYSLDDVGAKYMTLTYDVTEEGCSLFPAVVHVDKTARPQIVFHEQNKSFYTILQEYKKMTGVGVLVNTSFNMHEEPIVNTPQDAIRAFQGGAVDVLAIGDFIVDGTC